MTSKTWKETAAERRDARATKDELRDKPVNKKKNTKKWCRGKEGKEHDSVCMSYSDIKRPGTTYGREWKVLICKNCGKELETYYPFGKQEPPEWVKSDQETFTNYLNLVRKDEK